MIGGNYAVGIVVFAILTIINFVVITKGAGRVSEVTARFILDAMPGKQMAIDADLNAGLLTREEAKLRREEVREEADFYGAMDGASKFIRGDAIAGILILFINMLGGLAVGVLHGMPFGEAAATYTLLSIGDGLVAQLPALLVSSAVAMLVTRASRSQDMAQADRTGVRPVPRAGDHRRHHRPGRPGAGHAQRRFPDAGLDPRLHRLEAVSQDQGTGRRCDRQWHRCRRAHCSGAPAAPLPS